MWKLLCALILAEMCHIFPFNHSTRWLQTLQKELSYLCALIWKEIKNFKWCNRFLVQKNSFSRNTNVDYVWTVVLEVVRRILGQQKFFSEMCCESVLRLCLLTSIWRYLRFPPRAWSGCEQGLLLESALCRYRPNPCIFTQSFWVCFLLPPSVQNVL